MERPGLYKYTENVDDDGVRIVFRNRKQEMHARGNAWKNERKETDQTKRQQLAQTCDADVVAEDEPAGSRHEAAHHHREGDLAAVAIAGAGAGAAQRDHSPAVHRLLPSELSQLLNLVDDGRSLVGQPWSQKQAKAWLLRSSRSAHSTDICSWSQWMSDDGDHWR